MHSGEHVVLAMNFSRPDFVEKSHHDERVEYDREMLVRWLLVVDVTSAVDV